MTTPETILKNAVRRYLDERKKTTPLWYFKIHGGPMQKAGVPDLLVIVCGFPLFVELKAEGEEPEPLQVHVMKKISEAGGRCIVAYSVEDVAAEIDRIVSRLLAGTVFHLDGDDRRVK